MKLANAKVLLTGATGGIGRELARGLAAKNAHLILLGRNAEALAEFAEGLGTTWETITADLSKPLRQPPRRVDVLINNAGMTHIGSFQDEAPEDIERMLQVNLLAPMLLTQVVLPGMLERGSGRIVNIGSGFGAVGYPFHVSYSASKFGLRGFSEALRRELHGSNIGVTHVSPRATRTAMLDAEIAKAGGMTVDDPVVVAGKIIAAIEANRDRLTIGSDQAIFSRLNVVAPHLVDCGLRKPTRAMRAHLVGVAS
jgi:short-subunit dehydrogenase